MITTVTLNPAIDKFIQIEQLKTGEVQRIKQEQEILGGKGINVARVLENLGIQVNALCIFGQENIHEIERLNRQNTTTLDWILATGSTRTNYKFIETNIKNRTTDINGLGVTVSQDILKTLEKRIIESGKVSDYIVFSGSLPRGIDETYYQKVCCEISDRTRIVIDADGMLLKHSLNCSPYIVKPNRRELEAICGKILEKDEAVVKEAKKIMETYGIQYVLVTLGEDGCILVCNHGVYKANSLRVRARKTVGAGDAFLAGFIYGLSVSEDVKYALSVGTATSSLIIQSLDNIVLEKEKIKEIAREVVVYKIE